MIISATWILSGGPAVTAWSLTPTFLRYQKEVLRFNFLRLVQLLTAKRSSAVTKLSDRSSSVTLEWSKADNWVPDRPLLRKTFLSGSFRLGGRMVNSVRGRQEEGLVRLSKDKERREGME